MQKEMSNEKAVKRTNEKTMSEMGLKGEKAGKQKRKSAPLFTGNP